MLRALFEATSLGWGVGVDDMIYKEIVLGLGIEPSKLVGPGVD